MKGQTRERKTRDKEKTNVQTRKKQLRYNITFKEKINMDTSNDMKRERYMLCLRSGQKYRHPPPLLQCTGTKGL